MSVREVSGILRKCSSRALSGTLSSKNPRRVADVSERLDVTRQGPSSTLAASPRTAALTLLAHADPKRVGARAHLARLVELSRTTPVFSHAGADSGSPLDDPFLSRKPVLFLTSSEGVEIERAGSPISLSVDGELTDRVLIDNARLTKGVVLCLGRRVTFLLHWVEQAAPPGSDEGLLGVSDALAQVRTQVRLLAASNVPVLLLGESGVGKEMVARAIHERGARASKPFEAINMAAVPATLAASELFGHERGAFTGADRASTGAFQRADQGSLFLDELGDTPLEVQPLLLRALETNQVLPVGGKLAKCVDIRLLAATDVDLDQAIERGKFRSSLLHRLSGYRLALAPLRERRDDIGPLLHHFAGEEFAAMGVANRLDDIQWEQPWLGAPAVARLALHPLRGNARELKNLARQLVIACRDETHVSERAVEQLLSISGAPGAIFSDESEPPHTSEPQEPQVEMPRPPGQPRASSNAPAKPKYRDPSGVTEEELLNALKSHAFRLGPTAAHMQISRTSLYALVEQSSRIRKASELSSGEIDAAVARCDGRLDEAASSLEVSTHALKLRLKALRSG